MNQKLRDLQIQAFAECKTFEDGQFKSDEVFERFAQLIVEECIVIMNREIDEEESKEKNRTISDMMDLLEQHFGVSE